MKIQVTQEDIDKGIRQAPCSCPVGRAVKREIDGCVSVGYATVATEEKLYWLPDEVSNFIFNFDRGIIVKPFEFELE